MQAAGLPCSFDRENGLSVQTRRREHNDNCGWPQSIDSMGIVTVTLTWQSELFSIHNPKKSP